MKANVQTATALAAAVWVLGWGVGRSDQLQRVEIGAQAPGFSAMGSDGRLHALKSFVGKPVVLEWTSPVCPYTAMKYTSGAIQALQRQARRQGVVWLAIDTAAPGRAGFLTKEGARRRLTETKALVTAFLFDPKGLIGRDYGAKTTPSFYIIDAQGRLAYQGAMDQDPAADDATGKNYVRAALDDIAAGRPISVSETRPYGCAVEY